VGAAGAAGAAGAEGVGGGGGGRGAEGRGANGGGGALPAFTPQPLSTDHKADLPAERARIEAAGGRVVTTTYDDGEVGPPRVYLGGAEIPGLAMSRSLGDAVVHTVGVISEPETGVWELAPTHVALVIASDGLWEFCGNGEVATWAGEALASGAGDAAGGGGGGADLTAAAEKMVAVSAERWLQKEAVIDDTTVVLVALRVPEGGGGGPSTPPGGGAAVGAAVPHASAPLPPQKTATRRASFLGRLLQGKGAK
jgi:serine/threonine protein phosphatase PrpC